MSYQLCLRYSSRIGVHQQKLWTHSSLNHLAMPDYDSRMVIRLRRDRTIQRLGIDLRLGRFYPSRVLAVDDAPAAIFRIIDTDTDHLVLDFNHPLCGMPEQIAFESLPGELAGVADHQRLLEWAGLDTALPDHATDYGDDGAFTREDESDDLRFYRAPRKVMHVDAVCAARIAALYSELVSGRVLDLMASWCSHLPDDLEETIGLGLNADEMADNPGLGAHFVHDLNRQPALPFEDASFDAIVNTLSFEYLVDPEHVLASALEKLKPGGLIAIAFSNRFFPTKAIRLWRQLHPVERVAWTAQLLQNAGVERIHTLVEHGARRPADDPYAGHFREMDPMMAVWAYRS